MGATSEAELMKVDRHKGAALFVYERTGILPSEETVRKWTKRKTDPLPMEKLAGRVVFDTNEVDAWIKRNWRKKQ